MSDQSIDKDALLSQLKNTVLHEFSDVPLTEEDVKEIETTDKLPDVEPCEISEQYCDIITKAKKKAEKIVNAAENKKSDEIRVRLSHGEKEQLLRKCKEYGFANLSDFMRIVLLNCKIDVTVKTPEEESLSVEDTNSTEVYLATICSLAEDFVKTGISSAKPVSVQEAERFLKTSDRLFATLINIRTSVQAKLMTSYTDEDQKQKSLEQIREKLKSGEIPNRFEGLRSEYNKMKETLKA